jgi:hypothetical protein
MDTKFIGIIISAIIIIIGWIIAHRYNIKRDTLAKRRDLRVQYLLDAYRQLENTANRPINMLPETKRAFESAVADIQLLGTRVQIDALLTYLNQYIVEEGEKNIDPVLKILRDDLREELNLERDVPKIHQFRFKEGPKPT